MTKKLLQPQKAQELKTISIEQLRGENMSATSFNRMRRINAMKEALDAKGIDYTAFQYDETALRAALETAPEVADDEQVIETALRTKAKELGIKSWHIKSIETLTEEIAEKEKGGE